MNKKLTKHIYEIMNYNKFHEKWLIRELRNEFTNKHIRIFVVEQDE